MVEASTILSGITKIPDITKITDITKIPYITTMPGITILSNITMAPEITNISNITSSFQSVNQIQFSWYDYILFVTMLGLSSIIGIYFGCFGKKQDSTAEYLLGGKNMGVFPISMSLVSSLISGITILAVPADIYTFGITYWLSSALLFLCCLITTYVYLPVFYKCEITSTYEYLELRFDNRLRVMASFLFALAILLYLPIVIYIPALAFSQATGINIHLITPVVCSVCIFYTTIGGLKAVVWTDTLQFTAMIGAIGAVFYLGTASVGGISEVWRISREGGRLDFDYDVSPYKRDTFWSALVGLTIGWVAALSANQGAIQKFMALGSMKSVKKTMVIFSIGMFIVTSCSAFTGLIMYAKYYNCDPIKAGQVKQRDQLLPYYVMDVAGDIPGLPGLFIAGLFCAALSTLSAVLNSLAGTIFEDFIKPFMPKTTQPETVGRILKLIVILIGAVTTSLVFIVEKMGGLLPLAFSFGGVTTGPLLGLFTLGMLVPMANATGAFYGGIASTIIMLWTMIGAQYYKTLGIITYPEKPMSTEGCEFMTNETTLRSENAILIDDGDQPFFLYRITYYYYTLLGVLIIFIIAIPVSYFTRKTSKPINRDHISPVMHWLLPKEEKPEYYTIEKASFELTKNCD